MGSIHFTDTWYLPYGVSFLTPIHCCVLSVIFGPLVAKYLSENGVSGTFWKKNYGLNSFHTWHLSLCGVSLLTPIHFRVLSLIFGPLVAKYLAENGVSGSERRYIVPIYGHSLFFCVCVCFLCFFFFPFCPLSLIFKLIKYSQFIFFWISSYHKTNSVSVLYIYIFGAISVAWSVRAGQLAAGGVASVWRSWVRSPPGPR